MGQKANIPIQYVYGQGMHAHLQRGVGQEVRTPPPPPVKSQNAGLSELDPLWQNFLDPRIEWSGSFSISWPWSLTYTISTNISCKSRFIDITS